LEGDTKDLQEKNAEKLKGKESTDERRELDEEILNLKSELEGIQKDLAFFQRNDPKRLQEISNFAV
jgi:hypothetical protein